MVKKRKRHLSLVMAFVMFFSLISGFEPIKVLAAGSGTPESPYSVSEALNYVQTTYANTNPTGTVTVEGYIVGTYKTNGIILADNSSTPTTPIDKTKLLGVIASTDQQNIDTINLWNKSDKKGIKVRVTGAWRSTKPWASYDGVISTIGTVKGKDLTIVSADSPVTPPTVKPITGLTLPATAEVDVNKTTKISLTFAPSDTTETAVNWTSSDDTIATVGADGTVTGKTGGKSVTITATSAVNSAIKAQCTVTVKAEEPAITIAEARAKVSNSSVKVSGIVTYIDSTRYYIQDSTAAIALDAIDV